MTAVLTLALCIGANTAVFSVVDAVLLRPLPYPEPDRLATGIVEVPRDGDHGSSSSINGPLWEALRDNATQLECAAFGFLQGINLATGNSARHVRQQRVSAHFFRVLGVHPLIGREFSEAEDRPGGPNAAILSYGLWQRLHSGDTGVVGRTVLIAGQPHTIVGVMPADLYMPMPAELWTPLRPARSGEGVGFNYGWLARLRGGVTWAQAQAEVEAIAGPVLRSTLRDGGESARFRLSPFQAQLSSSLRTPLSVLMAFVAIVLLIGCANIAGLMLARAAGRRQEIATRIAVGGSRSAIIRQLLTESLILAILGGIAGVVLGNVTVRALQLVLQKNLGIWQPLTLDLRVLGATGALALLTSLLFGLLPALEASRVDLCASLSESGRTIGSARRRWPRRALVFTEVAMGVVLLFSAALLVRTFAHLRGLNPGFDPSGTLSARVSLSEPRYLASAEANRLFTDTLSRIRQLPGIEAAAVALHLPYERWINMGMRPSSAGGASRPVAICYITPEYLRVLRVPLLRGRGILESDSATARPVALVNQAFVRDRLAGRNSTGEAVWLGIEKQPREIVGLIGDVQQQPSFGNYGPIGKVPAVLVPVAQMPDEFLKLVHTWVAPAWIVRTSAPLTGVTAAMRRALESVNPSLPFSDFQHLDEVRAESMRRQRMQAVLSGTLAGLACLLAAVGLYGLVASSVAERRRELGIRTALGAGPLRGIRTVVGPVLALAAGGVLAGGVLARSAAMLLRSLLFGVSPGDSSMLLYVCLGMLSLAALAALVPALRFQRLNPAEILRDL